MRVNAEDEAPNGNSPMDRVLRYRASAPVIPFAGAPRSAICALHRIRPRPPRRIDAGREGPKMRCVFPAVCRDRLMRGSVRQRGSPGEKLDVAR